MTTGVPLYLVSACASAEEFVAAFRRYADRAGIFVPLSEPLPQGRRGRVALTLKDGGVMVEGEVEIVQSSPKASTLHGRVGMTIRFVEPDERSKTVLGELDKARLAMTPPVLSVTPRPAEIPAAPRATPPAIGGRIDAANALAECVVIGDVAALREPPADPNKSGPAKFVIPTIPNVRSNTPSTPPALTARPKTPSTPPALTPRPKSPSVPPELKPPPATPSTKAEQRMTSLGMPAMDRLPADKPKSDPALVPKGTSLGMPALTKAPADTAAYSIRDQIAPQKERPREDPTTPLMMRTKGATDPGVASPRRANTPSTPPSPRTPTPYAPLPIIRLPAADPEKTDLTGVPQPPPVGEEQRKRSLGVSMFTATALEEEEIVAVGPPPAPDPAAPVRPSGRSGGMRASEIMAAIPMTEDWTMTPDASAPTVLPAEAKVETLPPPPPPAAPPADDWTIKADPQAPDGWAAPAKVERLPEPKVPKTGNRVLAVSSERSLEAVEWEDKPTGIGEPLVEIDPTLMEPLKPMPIHEDEPARIVAAPPMHDEMPASAMRPTPLPLPLAPIAVDLTSRPRPDVTDGGTGFFRDSEQMTRYPTDQNASMVTRDTRKRTRTLVIVMSSALVVALGFVLVVALSGGKKPRAGKGSATHAGSGSAVAMIQPAPADAAVAVVAPPPAVDAGVATCPVEITTVPPGAEIAIDNTTVLGTTPDTFKLPCDVETKLYVRKKQFMGTIKPFTASAENTKLNIRLAAALFQIKVTSAPAGATITVGGKTVGITPTTIKLPAFASTSITLSKDGFVADTQKIAPRQNNAAHHVILKRAVKVQKLR